MKLVEAAPPAAGQTQRLAGASRDASLHDQLYRYAQDMQELLEDHNQLEQRYRTLSESYASLAEGRTVLESLIHASRDIYLMTDRKGTILRCNPAAEAIAPQSQLLGAYIGDLLEPAHQQRLALLLEALQRGGEPPEDGLELNIHAGAASTLIASVSPMPARVNGELRGIHWMIRDVTQAREAEFESRLSSLVLSSAVEGVLITDCDGDILAVNPAFTHITGYSAEEAVGRNPRFLQSGLQDQAFYDKMWAALRTEGRWQGQVTNRKKNGELYTEWMALTSAKDAEGKVLSYIAVFSDLTPLAQAEKRLFHLAYHDALTDLPNRQLLQDRLQQMIGLCERRGESFSVLFVNLDRFKQINDSLGYAGGDLALKEVAARLSTSIRAVDTAARLGSDDFAILAPNLAHEADIVLVTDKIVKALLAPMAIGGREFTIGASIGCALYPDHGKDAESLLRHADSAMRQAKGAGGNTHAIYRAAQASALPGDSAGR